MNTTSSRLRCLRKRAQIRSRTNPAAHAEQTSDLGEVSRKALTLSEQMDGDDSR